MKRALGVAAMVTGTALIMWAGVALDRAWIRHVTSKRTEQILADMQEQVDLARRINSERLKAIGWVAEGDTLWIRGNVVLEDPAVVGKPKRVSK